MTLVQAEPFNEGRKPPPLSFYLSTPTQVGPRLHLCTTYKVTGSF